METNQNESKRMKRALLVLNAILLTIGNCGGPLIMRLYFIHGGERVWLSSFLETGGWPLNFIPLIITYLHRRSKEGSGTKLFFMKLPVFLAAAVIGVLTGVDDYIYAYGMARLPVSTSSLISVVRVHPTVGGVDVQEGKTDHHLHPGVGDSIGDVFLCHSCLHYWYDHQQ